MNDRQKLVDLCFELVLTITDELHIEEFKIKSNKEKAAWVARQLKSMGFETMPCGMSWGVLKDGI